MKKTLVPLAVLGSFAGVASAATSVTLYGTVDAGYEGWSYGKDFSDFHNTFVQGSGTGPITGLKTGTSESNSKIGVKGQEDLGNGLAATFQLEGDVNADVGSSSLFNRESTVGLKGAFGEVKVGKSKSQMELALGGVVPGRRVADVDLYSVAAKRHSNGLFYSYDNAGFSFGADVTTKGGALGNGYTDTTVTPNVYVAEGADGSKVGYGARFGYYGHGLLARVAYQNDGPVVTSANAADVGKKQHEWAGVLAYNFYEGQKIPLAIGVSYAQGKGMAKGFFTATGMSTADTIYAKKAQTIGALVRTWFTPNDTAYVMFQKRKSTSESDATLNNAWAMALGYEHKLSKRTAVSVDTVYLKAKSIGVGAYGIGIPVSGKVYGYSVGLSHSF